MAAPPPSPAGPLAPVFRWAPGEAGRAALRPIRHPDIWEVFLTLQRLQWSAESVDLKGDSLSWLRLSPAAQALVRRQLAFFAGADSLVLQNLGDFGREVDCMEAAHAFGLQGGGEAVHSDAYSRQIEAIFADPAERLALASEAAGLGAVGGLARWVVRWFAGGGAPLPERLVAFAAVEGVMFSASFCILQWLREVGALPGVAEFNDYISRDEGIHTQLSCLLVRKYLLSPPPPSRAHEIFADLLGAMDAFVDEAFDSAEGAGAGAGAGAGSSSSASIGLDALPRHLLKDYVRFQADCVLSEMGYPLLWGARNPFPFMDKQSLNAATRVNFFEVQNHSYQTPVDSSFALDEDFHAFAKAALERASSAPPP